MKTIDKITHDIKFLRKEFKEKLGIKGEIISITYDPDPNNIHNCLHIYTEETIEN